MDAGLHHLNEPVAAALLKIKKYLSNGTGMPWVCRVNNQCFRKD